MAAVPELIFGRSSSSRTNSNYVNKIEKVKKSSSILNFHNYQQGAQAKNDIKYLSSDLTNANCGSAIGCNHDLIPSTCVSIHRKYVTCLLLGLGQRQMKEKTENHLFIANHFVVNVPNFEHLDHGSSNALAFSSLGFV